MVPGIVRRSDGATRVAVSASVVAGAAATLGVGGMPDPVLCSSAPLFSFGPSLPLGLLLALSSPASLAAGWAVMLGVMAPPLLVAPLRHLRMHSFASRRPEATACFCVGYLAAWTLAGLVVEAAAMAGMAVLGRAPSLVLALGVAVAWQSSPLKQRCLNGCHRLPALAAFGWASRRDAALFGLSHGSSCVGTCWALTLAVCLLPRGHLAAMAAVTVFALAERLERPASPAWRWRGAGKALRILRHRLVSAPLRRGVAPVLGGPSRSVGRRSPP